MQIAHKYGHLRAYICARQVFRLYNNVVYYGIVPDDVTYNRKYVKMHSFTTTRPRSQSLHLPLDVKLSSLMKDSLELMQQIGDCFMF